MTALTFTQKGSFYEATFSTAGAFTLHIEHDSGSTHITRLFSTSENGLEYAKSWESTNSVIDQDFLPLAESTIKYYKVVTNAMPKVAKWS